MDANAIIDTTTTGAIGIVGTVTPIVATPNHNEWVQLAGLFLSALVALANIAYLAYKVKIENNALAKEVEAIKNKIAEKEGGND